MSRRLLESSFFVGILVLYLATLCPTVYWYDSGEFITASALLDIAHPPGYPLYCLIGRLFSLLAASEPAWGVNLLSCLAGWGALFLIYLYSRATLRGLGPGAKRPSEPLLTLLSLAPPMVIGLSLDFWNVATFAENYTLDLLLWLSLVCLCTFARGGRGLLLCSFALGLLLAARSTNVFFLVLLLPVLQRRFRPRGKEALLGLVSFTLCLSLLLYLPLVAALGRAPHQGSPECWTGFISVTSAAGYGAYLSLSVVAILGRAGDLLAHLFRSLSPLGSLFLVAGLISLRRWRLSLLPLGLFALDVGVKLCFAAQVVQGHFYLTAVSFLSLYMAAGLWRLLGLRAIKKRVAIAVVVLVALLFLGLTSYPRVNKRNSRRAHVYGRMLLSLAEPRGARLLCGGDNDYQTARYLHHVLGERPDLELGHVSLLSEKDLRLWFSERSSVPLYLSSCDRDAVDRLGLERWGPLWRARVAPAETALPQAAPRVVFADGTAFRGFIAKRPFPGLPLLYLGLSWEPGSGGALDGRTVWVVLTDSEGEVVCGDGAVPFLDSRPLFGGGGGDTGAYQAEMMLVAPPGLAAGDYYLALGLSEGERASPKRLSPPEYALGNYLRGNPRTIAGIGFKTRLFEPGEEESSFLAVTDAGGMPLKGNFCLVGQVEVEAVW